MPVCVRCTGRLDLDATAGDNQFTVIASAVTQEPRHVIERRRPGRSFACPPADWAVAALFYRTDRRLPTQTTVIASATASSTWETAAGGTRQPDPGREPHPGFTPDGNQTQGEPDPGSALGENQIQSIRPERTRSTAFAAEEREPDSTATRGDNQNALPA